MIRSDWRKKKIIIVKGKEKSSDDYGRLDSLHIMSLELVSIIRMRES